MSGRDKMMSFDEHELQKERKKRHVVHKKNKDYDQPKNLRKPEKKNTTSKLSHKFIDYDSEDWYE
jgi:hypothetical protein